MQTTTDAESKINIKKYGVSRRSRIIKNMALILPTTVFGLLILMAIFSPLLAPHDPLETAIMEKRQPPFFVEGGSTKHILGTDLLGRDILSRLMVGARVSLSVSMVVIAITASVGTAIGITAGYLGGKVDAALMRFTDICMSFPGLLLAMLLSVSLGPGFFTVVLALSILGWAGYARLIRGEALRLRSADFVAQARIIGSSPLRIMLRHIFPNVVNPLIVVVTLSVGMIILAESALSYLGIGIPPPTHLGVQWWQMVEISWILPGGFRFFQD
jgi:ABC-type dipeptide/oligopeptide/nickel transport system permease subunit